MLRVVHDADVPLSAQGVSERLPQDSGVIHLSAIFRALGELMDAGEIRRIECAKGYVINGNGGGITLLCQGCGSYREVIADDLRAALRRLSRRSSFMPGRLVVEMVGNCRTCAAM